MKRRGRYYKVFNHVCSTTESVDRLVTFLLTRYDMTRIYEMGIGKPIKLTDGYLMIEMFSRKSDACYQFIRHYYEHKITQITWVNIKWFDEHVEIYRTIEEL